jgi:hypothetical protein
MKSRSLFLKFFAACLALVATPIFTAAQTTELGSPLYCMSGLIGLNRTQAATLNFTNVDRQLRVAHLYFLDADGASLKSSTERVMPGQSVNLMLSYSEVAGRGYDGRVQLRGVIVLADPPGESDPPGEVTPPDPDLSISSLEVLDEATGKTSFGLLVPAVRNARIYFPFATSAGR